MRRIALLSLLALGGLVSCGPTETIVYESPPALKIKPLGTTLTAANARAAFFALKPPAPLTVADRTVVGDVTMERLSNGLVVIVAANRKAPVVCVRSYVRAGGMYEGKYLGCGVSHLLEHLVAKGAVHDGQASGKPKQTRNRVDEIGGQSNASTGLARTQYYIAAAAGKTNDCIDLIADWMARPEITEEDFAREHGVVQRELEMGKDNPHRQMWYAHARNFYQTHPAATPVIGLAEPLVKLTRAEVLDYHRRMYVPQNMVVAIVGDVDTAEVLQRVRTAFAGFAPGRPPDLSLPAVPQVSGSRRAIVTNKSIKDAREEMSFRTIPLVHDDLYALDVLSYILTKGESSRLVRKVKREAKLVTSVSSSSWTPAWGAGQFGIDFRGEPALADKAEKAILAELAEVVAGGVTAEEVARAKRQKTADFVYSQQTVESQTSTLATDYLTTGDVEFSRRYTARIQKVTAEQVQAVAKKYFLFDRVIVTRMLPAGEKGPAAVGAGERAKATSKFFKLPNGLRVVLYADPSAGLVSTSMVTRGGLVVETPKTNGMGTLMTALSTRGAGGLSAEQIAAFFAKAGGRVSGACGNNTFYWQATTLADSFDEALPIVADIVQRPTYAENEREIIRKPLLAAVARIDEDAFGQLSKWFGKDFFGDSPLAMMRVGSEDVHEAATAESVAAYHKRYIKAGASVLAIYGEFDAEKVESRIRELFGDMSAGDVTVPQVAARKVADAGENYVHPTKLEGAAIMVGAPGMKLADMDDRLAIDVLDTIISGYHLPRGWLHSELRGKKLVYVVHAYNRPAYVPGAFQVYAMCEPKNAAQVAEIIRKNLRRTLTHKFTPDEVAEAVNMILTAELLDKQAMSSLAMQAALDELYGFGYDFRKQYEKRLRAVTPEAVSAAAEKYLSGGYVTTIVTPRPDLAGGGVGHVDAPEE